MKEQLISFETARLAKEAGFNETSDNWYRVKELPKELYGRKYKRGGVIPPVKQAVGRILAPTQSLLQKWIREEKNIIVIVMPFIDDWNSNSPDIDMDEIKQETLWSFWIWSLVDGKFIQDECNFTTYEDALEFGLRVILKNPLI